MSFTIYGAGAMEVYAGSGKAKEWRDECGKFFSIYCEDVKFINPANYYDYDSENYKTDNEVFKFSMHKVKRADLVLVNLDQIRNSVGSCLEVYEAYRSGIPVIGFTTKEKSIVELKKYIHPWIYEICDRIETGENGMNSALMYIRNYYLT